MGASSPVASPDVPPDPIGARAAVDDVDSGGGAAKPKPDDAAEGLPNPVNPANLDGGASLEVVVFAGAMLALGPKVKDDAGLVVADEEPKVKRALGFSSVVSLSPLGTDGVGLKPKLNEPLESDAVVPLPKRECEVERDDVSFFSSGLLPNRPEVGFSSEALEPRGFEKENPPVSGVLEGAPNNGIVGCLGSCFVPADIPKTKPVLGTGMEGMNPPPLVVVLISEVDEAFVPLNVNPPLGGVGMERTGVTGAGAGWFWFFWGNKDGCFVFPS